MSEAVETATPDLKTVCDTLRSRVVEFKTKFEEWMSAAKSMVEAANGLDAFVKDGEMPSEAVTAMGEMVMTVALCDRKIKNGMEAISA